jgi:hypothetical protein
LVSAEALDCIFLPAHVLHKKLVLAVVWSDDADKVSFTDPELIVVKDHRYAPSLFFDARRVPNRFRVAPFTARLSRTANPRHLMGDGSTVPMFS